MQDFWRDLSEGSQNAHLAERLREAQRTITDRPRISIRLRLVVSLALCFLLCVSFALSTLWLLGSVRQKLRILQAVESLDYKALRAQALSKDDILAGRDLGDALERVEFAEPRYRTTERALPFILAALLCVLGGRFLQTGWTLP